MGLKRLETPKELWRPKKLKYRRALWTTVKEGGCTSGTPSVEVYAFRVAAQAIQLECAEDAAIRQEVAPGVSSEKQRIVGVTRFRHIQKMR